MAIKITQNFLTKNDVYVNNLGRIDSRYVTFQDEGPKGLMLHSVGCSQPNAEPFLNNWNKPGVEKAVHAFIEADTIYQSLPWNYRGWHAGGSANNTHIGVEMCEPSTIKYTGGSTWVDLDPAATKAFVKKTYANAVELFADLCKQFSLDPLADGVIISHAEGHKRGIASNHGDPEHIWKKFGLSMNGFRADVAEAMKPKKAPAEETLWRVQCGAYKKLANATAQQKKLEAAGFKTHLVQADDGLYKIQCGAYSKKPNATAQQAALAKAGFKSYITTKGGKSVAVKTEPVKTIEEGSTVRVKKGAKTYTGKSLASFVYNRDHKVEDIDGNRVVITYDGVVVAAVHKKDLTLV